MPRFYLRSAFAALLVLSISGCDALNDAINDALPEVGISDGIFDLGGAAGTEVQGSFGSGAGKTAAVGTFSLTRTFDDLDSGDISEIGGLATSLIIALQSGNAVIVLNRGTAARLPDGVTVTGISGSWTLSDASATRTGQFSAPGGAFTLTRQASCSATAATCGYTASAVGSVIIIGAIDLAGGTAQQLYAIVAQSTPPTTNTVSLDITMTVSNSDAEMAGIGATIRVGETDTTVQPILF